MSVCSPLVQFEVAPCKLKPAPRVVSRICLTAAHGHAPERCIVDRDLNEAGQRHWERECVARALAGEAAAFGELYDAYAERLYGRVLFPLLGNASAAEDALSETFRVAFQRLADFEAGEVSIYFWLARIAKNKALDMHRAKKATGRVLANFESLLVPLCHSPDSPEDLLDRETSKRALGQAVQRTLEELNDRYRHAIELRFLQDQPRDVCAEQLGVKLGTFDVLILRALRAFRKRWEEQPDIERPSTESEHHEQG
jgi:RNA polymerase sigma factor (sigma-70 family)